MVNVREVHHHVSGKWILFCDLFDDEIICEHMVVNGTVFNRGEFQVEKPTGGCFSPAKYRNIVLSTDMDCSNVQYVSFS